MTKPNHYETLGVGRYATADDINAAFRSRARAAHPDKGGTHEDMQALNVARDTLLDDKTRAAYDQELDGNLIAAARHTLRRVFSQIVEADSTVMREVPNIVAAVFDTLAQSATAAEADRRRLQSRRQVMTVRRRRIKTKAGVENLFHALIDERLAQIDEQIASIDRVIPIYAECTRLLTDYEDTGEREGAPMAAFDTGLRAMLRGLQADRIGGDGAGA